MMNAIVLSIFVSYSIAAYRKEAVSADLYGWPAPKKWHYVAKCFWYFFIFKVLATAALVAYIRFSL